MQQYKILNIIGQGAFGNAYLARHLAQDKNYVIKKIQLTNKTTEQTENIFNEVKLLQQFKHVNIVSYRESIIEGQELNIIMEFCYGGDLNQLITEQKQHQPGKKLEEPKIIDWATQIALAIFYMHDKRILHRDIKTPNIFISDDKVKLGDFGISKVLDEKIDLASTSIGTPYYMSPEQYKHKPYSYKSDMWAFGCILYEMCNQKRPFEAYSLNGLAVKVLEANFAPVSQYYSKELRELIKKMLQKKEKDRPLIYEFIQTPIIKKRAIRYLRQMYDKLKQDKDSKDSKVLQEGVMYQAKKLGIQLIDRKQTDSVPKKGKSQFSAQKKNEEKERIRKQLEEQLRKLSQKDKQQKQELRKLTEDRKNLLKKNKKQVDRSQITNRKSHSSSTKSLKQQYSTATESKRSSVPSLKNVEERQKPFEIKQKFDMYEMEFEQDDSDEQHVEPIDQMDQQEEKGEKQNYKHEPKQYEKQKYIKLNQISQPTQSSQIKETPIKVEIPKVVETPKIIETPKLVPPPQEPIPKEEPQLPIEQAIVNLKESLKLNNQALNTIKNELSNIDFSISSSEDELDKTVQKPEQLPVMKKKNKNPIHVMLSDKVNDLRQSLQQLLSRQKIQRLIKLAESKGIQATRSQIDKITDSSNRGTYHLAIQVMKLSSLMDRVPLFIS